MYQRPCGTTLNASCKLMMRSKRANLLHMLPEARVWSLLMRPIMHPCLIACRSMLAVSGTVPQHKNWNHAGNCNQLSRCGIFTCFRRCAPESSLPSMYSVPWILSFPGECPVQGKGEVSACTEACRGNR